MCYKTAVVNVDRIKKRLFESDVKKRKYGSFKKKKKNSKFYRYRATGICKKKKNFV